jgi:hypothetical protein
MYFKTFSKAHVAISLAVLLVFIFIVNPASYYFLNDDFIHIPLAAQKIFFYGSLLRPLSDFTLWLDHAIWQKNAYGYHLTNICIHVLNSILVFFASRALFSVFSDNERIILKKSFSASLLFLIYAFHSESIFWIIGRGGSLCTLFFLLALIFYFKKQKNRFAYFFCLLFFSLGLLVYESIWVFPLIISVTYFFKPEKKMRYPVGVWLIFILYLFGRFWWVPVDDYELGVLTTDFYKLLYNVNTLFARCFLPPMQNSNLFLVTYILLWALLIFSFLKLKSKHLVYFIVCLFVSLAPVVSLGIDTHDSESERFIYLASFFAVLVLVEMFSALKGRFAIYAGISFLSLHAYWLSKTAETYKIGSLLAKQSLDCIGKANHFKTIYAIDLPTQYKGALIFRKGFGEAVRWINNIHFDSVVVVSNTEVYGSNILQCVGAIINSGDINIPFNKQKQILFVKYGIKTKAQDVLLIWNRNSLEIIR